MLMIRRAARVSAAAVVALVDVIREGHELEMERLGHESVSRQTDDDMTVAVDGR